MTTIILTKPGTADKITGIAGCTIKADGTIWHNGVPLTNSTVIPAATILDIISRKAWGELPETAYIRLGLNPGDKEVVTLAEYSARCDAIAEAKLDKSAMSDRDAQRAKEDAYDALHNEGSRDGYNPYRTVRGSGLAGVREPDYKPDLD